MFCFVIAALGQTDDKVVISTRDLTPDQLAKIQAEKQLETANAQIDALQKKVETYGKWVGVGGEIGQAVKDGLNAVVDVADKFGGTNVGKFTMSMIAWKVIGKDIAKIVLGLMFFLTMFVVIWNIYKKVILTRKYVVNDPGLFKYPKEYKVVESNLDGEEKAWLSIALLCVLGLSSWITYAIMF